MATVVVSPPAIDTIDTLADLWERLGRVPLDRIRFHPAPGTATEADVLVALEAPRKRICELIDGVLVEKAMGFREARLAAIIIRLLDTFVSEQALGIVTGADGTLRLWPGRVRIPDVAFFSRQRFPNLRVPEEPIPHLVPDLAVEVLSRSNTPAEMRLKREDYFTTGVRLVWEIDLPTRTVAVYTRPAEPDTVLTESDTLTGGDVLPGFTPPVRDLFVDLGAPGT
jgi:Uma2 family endonuclease